MKRYLTGLIFSLLSSVLTPSIVYALDSLSFEIERLEAHDWQLNQLNLSLFDLQNQSQQLSSSIKLLSLPEPFSKLKIIDIQCLDFRWQTNLIVCKKGKGKLKSKVMQSPNFDFSFLISDQYSEFSISNFKFSGGKLSLLAKLQNEDWNVELKSKNIQLKRIKTILMSVNKVLGEFNKGKVDTTIQLKGHNFELNKLKANIYLKQLGLQANKGDLASEGLNLQLNLTAKLKKGIWYWKSNNLLATQGEFYIAPVYISLKDSSINGSAQGRLLKQGTVIVDQASLIHQDIFRLDLQNSTLPQSSSYQIKNAQLSAKVNNLALFTELYVVPYTDQTALEGLKLTGQLQSTLEISQAKVQEFSVDLDNVKLNDDENRVLIEQVEGQINWSNDVGFTTASNLRWNHLKLKAIPIDKGQIHFLFKGKSLKLLKQSNISLLGGEFNIKQFSWQNQFDDEPKVYFSGAVNRLSLEQLSKAFGWTPLSGNISGEIPGVDYENKKLSIKGELKVNVFDGLITIKKLASSGMFTDFSKFYMDMKIDNLDLYALTQKFEVGAMEGRISGFINDLYLENWQPVKFIAWIGTPENDNSRHRISQKAVENIASIGGGGAADIISKGFLRFFDTFGYERIGFGCYLNQGVCQLMGVEATEQGYYIIKGGGLPRIDVMGYNPRVDWDVLLQRLSRITSSEEIKIE